MDKATRKLPLGRKGQHNSIVDEEDYQKLSEYNWGYHRTLGYAYRQERINGKKQMIYLHREVMGLKHGENDGMFVDHIDGDRLNNSRSNLRVCKGNALNAQNRGSHAGSSSSYRGVAKAGDRWRAYASTEGRTIHIGYFKDELKAALAAQDLRRKIMPWAQDDPRLA